MTSQQKDRPLVTFALFAYNQEQYIREAVEGAFSQTYSPLEIILSDDCSPDSTFEIMKEMAEAYEGPHKVILNRNEKNLRLTGHVNHMMNLSSGEIVVLAAGDDISLPRRTERSVELMSDGAIAVSFATHVFSKVEELEPPCEIKDVEVSVYSWDAYLKNPRFHLNGAARSFRKNIFEVFSTISPDCPTEDTVILLRALILGSVKKSEEVMVCYRVHENNLSSVEGLQKMNFDKIYDQYLRDMQLATQMSILSPDDFEKLNKAMKSKIESTIAINSFRSSGAGMVAYLKYILLDPVISIRRKVGLFVRIFLK